VDPHLLTYNDTWDKVDAMLREALSPAFRERIRDSHHEGWVYNWFCVDHVCYELNPRRRDIGFHNVFDHYQRALKELEAPQDGVHFHFHPHPFRSEAHLNATHWWASSPALHQILSRRVIDRLWFPAAHRPGFHVIRPDSHWFLEQFIPFDYSSQAMAPTEDDATQFGVAAGRYGDWGRAPISWTPYHPDHDDYQIPGRCRRWIARCLNVGTRFRLINEKEVRLAFQEAREGKPVVLAVTNHDFRDLRPDVDQVRTLLAHIAVEFPDVPFLFAEAVDAMRMALGLPAEPPCSLDLSLARHADDAHILSVETDTPSFGVQPWLAIKTVTGTYHHDNFTIEVPFRKWTYVFDEQTFPIRAVDAIGVAANNAAGVTTVSLLNPATGFVARRYWNEYRHQGDATRVPDTMAAIAV
jgi:hypothetical protein